MTTPVFILGRADVEMVVIEELLRDNGFPVFQGVVRGKAANVKNAYHLEAVRPKEGTNDSLLSLLKKEDAEVVFIECDSESIRRRVEQTHHTHLQIDHHHPGDFGFDTDPMWYLSGSSLGQVLEYLVWHTDAPLTEFEWHPVNPEDLEQDDGCGITFDLVNVEWQIHRIRNGQREYAIIPEYYRWVAAADHCLASAYQGMCPGVDPEALQEWRLRTRAARKGMEVEDLRAVIESTRSKLRLLEEDGIADLTVYPKGTLPEAPEAAAQEHLAILTSNDSYQRQYRKLSLVGSIAPDRIQTWMDHQTSLGREVYGNPTRGYAGAIIHDRHQGETFIP
jgi:hypothetical protein